MKTEKIILTQFTLAELSGAITKEILDVLQLTSAPPTAARNLESPPIYLTRKEVAEKLRISLPTLDKYTKEGKITAYRVAGKGKRFLENDVTKCLNLVKTIK